METAEGTISASFGPGTVAGFDLAAFLTRITEGGFFALRDIPGGTLNVERAELKAIVGSGLARIDKADIATPDRIISLIGIVPHIGRGLALSGAVLPKAAEGGGQPLARFFVGGSWSAPFVSPAFIPAADRPAPAD
jgi:AsmA protein